MLAAPQGAPDHYVTPEDVTLNVPEFAGVRVNDQDGDNDRLETVLVSGTAHGSLTLQGDGSFTYRPALNYNGPDAFTYRPWDGKTALDTITPVTVSLLVNAVNDAPVSEGDRYEAVEGRSMAAPAPGVLVNDYTVDVGRTLKAALVRSPSGAAAGAFSLAADGSFTYTPKVGFSGADSFTYRAIDDTGLAGEETTVVLQVEPRNTAPTPADDAFSMRQGEALFVDGPGVLGNDSDAEADRLQAFLETAPQGGNVSLSENGSFVYTPREDFRGTDSFTYRISDGTLRSTGVGLVTITVQAVNHAPVATQDGYDVEAEARLILAAPGVLVNDGDPDGDVVTSMIVSGPQNGSVSLNADGRLEYVPAPNFVGIDAFTYAVSDGKQTSAPTTVTIRVTPITRTTAALEASSDTGASANDRVTADSTPTFSGTTRADLVVRLFARPAESAGGFQEVGSTTADSLGNYSVTATRLADGLYEFQVAAFRPDGLTTGMVTAGTLLVDTTAPTISEAVFVPTRGEIRLTYVEAGSGLIASSVESASVYRFGRSGRPAPQLMRVNSAALDAAAFPGTRTFTSILKVANGKVIPRGLYLLDVVSGGVADRAGNALDGEFRVGGASGDGLAGGDYRAQFRVVLGRPSGARATTFVLPRPVGPARASDVTSLRASGARSRKPWK